MKYTIFTRVKEIKCEYQHRIKKWDHMGCLHAVRSTYEKNLIKMEVLTHFYNVTIQLIWVKNG